MKINLTGLKVSDIIDQSKSTVSQGTTPPPIPESINQDPGNPKSTVDTSQSDSLGQKSVDSQTQAADMSSVQKRKEINPAGKDIGYNKIESRASDQAKAPNNATDVSSTQAPKQKSFKQALMDKMAGDTWNKSSSGTPDAKRTSPDSTGPDQSQHKPAHIDPQNTKRPPIGQFDPRRINTPKDPNPPAIDSDSMLSRVKSPNINMPNIKLPSIRPNFR